MKATGVFEIGILLSAYCSIRHLSSPLFGASLFCLDFREHLDWFSLFFFVILPASGYNCAAFWGLIGRGLFGFSLFCVASPEPTCFLFWIREKKLL